MAGDVDSEVGLVPANRRAARPVSSPGTIRILCLGKSAAGRPAHLGSLGGDLAAEDRVAEMRLDQGPQGGQQVCAQTREPLEVTLDKEAADVVETHLVAPPVPPRAD